MPIKATRVKRDIYYLGSRENWIMDILCNITFQNMKEQTSKGKWFYPKYTAKEASLS
jgi:hypothetical protein